MVKLLIRSFYSRFKQAGTGKFIMAGIKENL